MTNTFIQPLPRKPLDVKVINVQRTIVENEFLKLQFQHIGERETIEIQADENSPISFSFQDLWNFFQSAGLLTNPVCTEPQETFSKFIQVFNHVLKRTSLWKSKTFLEYFGINRSFENLDEQQVSQLFNVLKVIGKGCMGKVFLVQDKFNGRYYALKSIHKKWVVQNNQVHHTRTERDVLEILSRVDHPFLLKMHHAFQSECNLNIVLDYHAGGDMASQLFTHRKFPEPVVKFYAAEIILGLEELHRHEIIYRDLKPENILIKPSGHIVLSDFGLSKILTPEHKTTRSFCGTPEYLAPEILIRNEYTKTVDFWSLGIFIFEMLYGITPFWADTSAQMYQRVIHDPLYMPAYRSTLSKHLVSSLLERDPVNRIGANCISEVKNHPFFQSISWQSLLNEEVHPPFIPPIDSAFDSKNFDSEFTSMTPKFSPQVPLDFDLQKQFEGFSFGK